MSYNMVIKKYIILLVKRTPYTRTFAINVTKIVKNLFIQLKMEYFFDISTF